MTEVTTVEVTVSIRLSAPSGQVVDTAAHLAETLREALDVPAAEVVVDLPLPRAELRILADSRRVLHRGRDVELTRLEFDLLHHLCTHPRQVHRRTALMNSVWGATSFVDTRTVDVHVRRIRRKLGEAASLITTVRGVGYRVDNPFAVSVEHDALAG
ncbi:winged helix-turn-helix domain-containing protein [Saccharothrix variisporea]|uniref:Transcriptional regulator n=1 Tax=Saccharothrix variisporea TaxID=543527 RepID=A0A495X4C6_9PSEU|nr:winged helix-turn-helix domain-containing protein [Saccharothrix variisporea]RKT68767.1 transcriptional regulator [Saccharothrix variisporea]